MEKRINISDASGDGGGREENRNRRREGGREDRTVVRC